MSNIFRSFVINLSQFTQITLSSNDNTSYEYLNFIDEITYEISASLWNLEISERLKTPQPDFIVKTDISQVDEKSVAMNLISVYPESTPCIKLILQLLMTCAFKRLTSVSIFELFSYILTARAMDFSM